MVSKSKPYTRGICRSCEAENEAVFRRQHHPEILADMKAYREANKAQLRRTAYEKRHALKHKVMQAYGGRCVCCGEDHELQLNIDHIYNDGKQHREELGGYHSNSSKAVYKWLEDNNFPSGFQVLCFNCNISKQRYGLCPHERDRRANGITNPNLTGPDWGDELGNPFAENDKD